MATEKIDHCEPVVATRRSSIAFSCPVPGERRPSRRGSDQLPNGRRPSRRGTDPASAPNGQPPSRTQPRYFLHKPEDPITTIPDLESDDHCPCPTPPALDDDDGPGAVLERIPTILQPSLPWRKRIHHVTFAWYTVTYLPPFACLPWYLPRHRLRY